MNPITQDDWQRVKADVFWGEIAPCEHVLQIYEDNDVFLDTLAGFAGSGFNAGDSVIIIATKEHLQALEDRLKAHGMHTDSLIAGDQYIPLDAEKVLSEFMVNGWPDEALFMNVVSQLIQRARKNNKQVRVFGEMVAMLWEQGHSAATVQLEHLWNKFCASESLSLFCAYPQSGFTKDANTSLVHICDSHSKHITGSDKPLTEIFYRNSKQVQSADPFIITLS